MSEIKLMSFAKINLSIDVGRVQPSGMHPVDMVMHQVSFHDDVVIKFTEDLSKEAGDVSIKVSTNKYYIPVDNRNLAFKAVDLLREEFGEKIPGGSVDIKIHKRIPVAGGLAGGSGNGAAVLHGLNLLWHLNLSLEELCRLGAKLGSDVPFCIMGQARCNYVLPKNVRKNPEASCCARATGTGTDLKPLRAVKKALVIANPRIPVSTKEVYQGIDLCEITDRPNNDQMEKALYKRDFTLIYRNCVNVLEQYTLKKYDKVAELKSLMEKDKAANVVLMSGSGPTVFAMYDNVPAAKRAKEELKKMGYEAYWTRTTV